jgi:hypothetical protein
VKRFRTIGVMIVWLYAIVVLAFIGYLLAHAQHLTVFPRIP